MINPIKPILKILANPWIPGVIIAVAGTAMVLNATGYITLPHINLPNLNIIEPAKDGVYTFPPAATVGKYFEYDFSTELIQKLEPQGRESPGIYSFYLGSGVGFPPMGLNFDPLTGILSGAPKERLTVAADSKFEVCVKDVGGKSACKTYSMTVEPKTATTLKTGKTTTPTPTLNGNAIQGGGFSGVWEGEMILIFNDPEGLTHGDGNAEELYQLNLTQNGNKLTGTMTVTLTKANNLLRESGSMPGFIGTMPITGTVIGTSVKFTISDEARGGATDYTFTLTGNTLNIKFVDCHNPDPRCMGVVVVGSGGNGVPDAISDVPWWFSGESTATRKK